MANSTILELENLWIRYSSRDRWLFEGVSFSMRPGDRVLLTGPSGSGKSTLLYSIAGLIPDHVPAILQGAIRIQGREVGELTPLERSQSVGIVFQDPETQFCTLSVEDELAFGLENLNVHPQIIEERIHQVLTVLRLEHIRYRKISRLSGGEKQLVALASVLSLKPKLLLLDEVASNLDPENARLVYHTLAELFSSMNDLSCMCVEHRPQAVLSWMTHWAHLDGRGKIEWKQIPLTDGAGTAASRGEIESDCPGGSSDPDGPVVVICKDLSFAYPITGDLTPGRRQTLHKVSLELRQGEIVALLGRNGSGKTTLLKLLVGALHPQSGIVRICGKDPTRMTAKELSRCCSFLFQNPEHQFIRDTVREEILQSLSGREDVTLLSETTVADLLKKVSLDGKEQANPFALSMGEKRRLTLACALAVGSQVFLLDEPTFGQDPDTARQLGCLLLDMKQQGHTLLMVTHDEEFAQQYADRILRMEELQYDSDPSGGLAAEEKEGQNSLQGVTKRDNRRKRIPVVSSGGGFRVFTQYEQDSWLARVNPLCKLSVSLAFMLFSTIVFDVRLLAVWSAGAFVGLWGLGKVSPRLIVRSTLPFFLLGLGFLWANVLFPGARNPIEVPLLALGPISVFSSSILFGLTMVARSITFGLFSFLFVSTTDPMDFIVSLMHQAHLSPRKAFSLLAVHRFLPLLQEEWEQIQLAHRLRGLGYQRGIRGKWDRFKRFTLPLIAGAVRKADRVAMAMETRGLTEEKRSSWRKVRKSYRDLLYLLGWIVFCISSYMVIYRMGTVVLWKGQL